MKVLVALYQAFLCCIFATLRADGVQVGLLQEAPKALHANVSSCLFCLELYAELEFFILLNFTVANVEKKCKSLCKIQPSFAEECDEMMNDIPQIYIDVLKGIPSNSYCNEVRFCINATNTTSSQRGIVST